MLSPNDARQFANTLGSEGGAEGRAEDETVACQYDVGNLDYTFVERATRKDIAELQTLLRVLRSGKEGLYPELEVAFENKIVLLDPSLAVRIRDTKSTSSRSDYTGHELYAAQAELADWATTMKQQDDQLRSYAASNSGGKVVRKVDSGVSIRGHCGANAAHQDTGSLSSTCSSNNTDNEQDDHSAQISSVSRPFRSEQPRSSSTGSPPRSILKSSTSRSRTASGDEADVDAEKKLHVRFQDEVEARAKELERVRRKQEKRQKQIELHNAHPLNVKKKTASSSNGKGKSRSKSPQERQQPIGQSDLSSQLQQQSQNMAKKSGILIQEIDSSVLSLSGSTTIETESPHARIKSYDYGAWDKFNIDVELSKLDAENANPPASANATRISMLVDTESVVSQDLDVEVESDLIATRLADDEKVKGNDCFKANEYVDALAYYTRSLKIKPQAAVFNNRALVHIKMKKFEKAENDASAALAIKDGASEFKSLLRRALARSKRGKYIPALQDLDKALAIAPMNKEAVILRKEVARKFDDVEGDNAANLWERSVQGEPGKICDAEEEKVDGEIVTPFGKSCGGVLSRPSGKGIITKDKGKAKTDGYAVFDEPLGEEQALLAAMEEKCATATESYRRHMEEMCKKLPGYASGSGTVREVSDECVEQALRQITGGGKIEIQDVDFDSDDDEAQPESPNSESAKFSKDYDISKKQLTSSARGVAGSHENGRKVGGADIQVPDGSVLESSDQKANDINMSEQQCLASIPKPQLHFALATSSYEFENAWKTLKGNEKSWSVYIKTLPSASFSKLLSNVGNPSILPALFRAFQVIALDDPDFVCDAMEDMRNLPRLKLLLKLFNRREKEVLSKLVQSLACLGEERIAKVTGVYSSNGI